MNLRVHTASIRAAREYAEIGLIQNEDEYYLLDKQRRLNLSAKKWKLLNKEQNLATMRRWRMSHYDHAVQYRKQHQSRIRKEFWLRRKQVVFGLLGGRCACSGCDIIEPEFLSIDHIVPVSTQDRKLLRREHHSLVLYRKILHHPNPRSEYRLLCFNCNMATRYFRVCPHNREEVEQFTSICRSLTV